MEYIKWLKEHLIPHSMKATDLTWWKTELDWTKSDLHNGKRPKEAELPVTRSQPSSSEPVTKGKKSQALRLTNSETPPYT
jgi:hypothetical protein